MFGSHFIEVAYKVGKRVTFGMVFLGENYLLETYFAGTEFYLNHIFSEAHLHWTTFYRKRVLMETYFNRKLFSRKRIFVISFMRKFILTEKCFTGTILSMNQIQSEIDFFGNGCMGNVFIWNHIFFKTENIAVCESKYERFYYKPKFTLNYRPKHYFL